MQRNNTYRLPLTAAGFCRAVQKIIRAAFCLAKWAHRAALLDATAPDFPRRVALLTRDWGRENAAILGLQISVSGAPEPEGSVLFVANHIGYADIFVHAALFPVRFAAKAELADGLVIGSMLKRGRLILIDRSRRAGAGETADAIAEALREGSGVFVYPEGTSSDGAALLPFKSTAFESAIRENILIQPVLTFYEPAAGEGVAWYGEQKLLPHLLRFCALQEVKCHVYLLEPVRRLPGESRKELASRVRTAMEREYASKSRPEASG